MTIGEQIKALRRERDLTQKELAKLTDTSVATISSIERNDGRISEKTKRRILDMLFNMPYVEAQRAKTRQKKRETPKNLQSNRRCRSCYYYLPSIRCCNYLKIVGHSRGCDIEGCTKYEKLVGRRPQENNRRRPTNWEDCYNYDTEREKLKRSGVKF